MPDYLLVQNSQKKVVSMDSNGSHYKNTKSTQVSPDHHILLYHCYHDEFYFIWFALKRSSSSRIWTITVSYKADFITTETRRLTGILLFQERKFWNITNQSPTNLCIIFCKNCKMPFKKACYCPIICTSI